MDEHNRPSSPFLAPENEDGIRKFITPREKIHRIRCQVGYHATVSAVYSPSDIWLRTPNHISKQLTLPRSNPPPLEENIAPNAYVMTPINEAKLARARILQLTNDGAYVRYIDSGKTDLKPKNELYEMKDELRTHPWQAIHVALHNVHPLKDDAWSPVEIETIRFVFADFPCVWVIPQLSQRLFNDDSEPARVILNGLTDEDVQMIETTTRNEYDECGQSIIDRYICDLPLAPLGPKPIIDALDYQPYPIESD